MKIISVEEWDEPTQCLSCNDNFNGAYYIQVRLYEQKNKKPFDIFINLCHDCKQQLEDVCRRDSIN